MTRRGGEVGGVHPVTDLFQDPVEILDLLQHNALSLPECPERHKIIMLVLMLKPYLASPRAGAEEG